MQVHSGTDAGYTRVPIAADDYDFATQAFIRSTLGVEHFRRAHSFWLISFWFVLTLLCSLAHMKII